MGRYKGLFKTNTTKAAKGSIGKIGGFGGFNTKIHKRRAAKRFKDLYGDTR